MALPKALAPVSSKLSKEQKQTLSQYVSGIRSDARELKGELAEYQEMLAPVGNIIRKGIGLATGAAMAELDLRAGTMEVWGREVPASLPAAGVVVAAAALTGDKTIDDVAQSASGVVGYVANLARAAKAG